MTEIFIAIITLTAAIWAFVAARRLLSELTETVTIWDYQSGLHFKDGRYIESLAPGKHRFWGRGHRVVVYENRLAERVIQSQVLLTIALRTLAHATRPSHAGYGNPLGGGPSEAFLDWVRQG